MNTIKVINPGFLTTIQDDGRIGYQQFGVPISGAMDVYALQLANILVNNEKNEACLEMTMIGAHIEFYFDTAIAITGADMNPEINFVKINMYETIYVKAGDVLRMSTAKDGARSYLSISGGFDIPKVLGSKSTYIRGKIGGYKGRKIKFGDEIVINKKHELPISKRIPLNMIPKYMNFETIRVIQGPEEETFKGKGLKTFFENEYIITNQSDRMGYKLKGKKIKHRTKPDIISAGISLGTIQVPGNGQPMVMLQDKQTTGGYTRIANVITVDIPKFGQLKAGDKIRFQEIELSKALKLLIKQQNNMDELVEFYKKIEEERAKYFSVRVNNKEYSVIVEECQV